MKKKALALVLCISIAAVMFTGCKTVVQNPTGTTPQVISQRNRYFTAGIQPLPPE